MAGTITLTCQLKVDNGNFKLPQLGSQQTIVQNKNGAGVPGFIEVTTHAGGTLIAPFVASIEKLGWCRMQNIDPDRIAELGLVIAGIFHPLAQMNPNEPLQCRLSNDARYSLALRTSQEGSVGSDAEPHRVQVWIQED